MGKADPLKPAAEIEASRQFIGQRLIVHKAVGAGGLDGLFVKVHRIERPVFDAGDLSAYQSGAVLEILRAMLRPDFELPQMGGHGLQMLLPLAGACGIAACGAGKSAVKVIVRQPKKWRCNQ